MRQQTEFSIVFGSWLALDNPLAPVALRPRLSTSLLLSYENILNFLKQNYL